MQHEINTIKQEINKLKHKNKNIKPELIMLKDDEHKDGKESSQQALLSDKGILHDAGMLSGGIDFLTLILLLTMLKGTSLLHMFLH